MWGSHCDLSCAIVGEAMMQNGRYDYERIGEKPFQQLCNALLADRFPDVQCFPVGHSDGGRDAVLPRNGKPTTIFQVKWTSKPTQSAVSWLTQAIKGEKDNIRRLVSQGAKEYYLLTSVAGTAVPGRGSMDRLDEALAKHSLEFGIPMKVWWRADIDARVDSSPDALKWAYSDMLAGHDLVRYLIEGATSAAYEHELRTLVMNVIATQWDEDSRVKFKQAELTSDDLADLFIDVEAVRTAQALTTRGLQLPNLGLSQVNLGGAAKYLLSTRQPFTVVKGEPGQGKSTLGQYLCQVHRAAFLKKQHTGLADLPPTAGARVPLRIDLRDYAAWLDGGDPLEEHVGAARTARRRKASLEDFVAYFLRARSGGRPAEVTTVDDIFGRLPVLIVLDGLDEVARAETRTLVVKHIDEFSARLQNSLMAPQVVVTTRPNAAELAEPSPQKYETISLSHLKRDLRMTYLRKWAAARSVIGRHRRELEHAFHQRSAEPHINQLADNPMQLTILLYLLHKRGNSVPAGRTELYSSYMETFLDREAEKSQQVEEHRRDLEEITAFLGWLLQSEAEQSSGDGRIALRDLQRSILTYLFDADKNTELVNALFTAVTDRVWALTSKIQGLFEFDVQPLREYFAARYLYEYAGADQRQFDTSLILRHLAGRPYWMNVARFFAGFARANELAGLIEALEEEKDSTQQPLQLLTTTWTLLADGVFRGRPKSQQRAAELFLDDLSLCLLASTTVFGDELPTLALDCGGQDVADRVLASVREEPRSPMAGDRIRLAARLLPGPALAAWWQSHLNTAAGGPDEDAWLAVGAVAQVGQHVAPQDVPPVALHTFATAADTVAAGLTPPEGTALESRLVETVLAGHCSDVLPTGRSYAADLLRLFAPQHLMRPASPLSEPGHLLGFHYDIAVSGSQQRAAWIRLIRREGRFAELRSALKDGKGQGGTTSRWGNTARALSRVFGPCWLAAEIAVIGAALPSALFVTGGDTSADSQPLGPDADYGRLLQDARRYRQDPRWWAEQQELHQDVLSRATWALALLTIADPPTVASNLDRLESTVTALPDDALQALLLSSSRTGTSSRLQLRARYLQLPHTLSPAVAILLAHRRPDAGTPMKRFDVTSLGAMARYGRAAWPAAREIVERTIDQPTEPLLAALRAHGPSAAVLVTGRGFSDDDLYRQILRNPAEYPRALVWTLQSHLSQPHPDHMAAIAATEKWFSPVSG